MTDDVTARLARLEARAEIADLVARYTLHAAAGEAVELASLFTKDGAFRSASGEIRGRDALANSLSGSLTPGKTVPIAGQLHITFDGEDRARLKCLMASTFHGGKPGGFCGHYNDELAKEDGEWRFVSRTFTHYHEA